MKIINHFNKFFLIFIITIILTATLKAEILTCNNSNPALIISHKTNLTIDNLTITNCTTAIILNHSQNINLTEIKFINNQKDILYYNSTFLAKTKNTQEIKKDNWETLTIKGPEYEKVKIESIKLSLDDMQGLLDRIFSDIKGKEKIIEYITKDYEKNIKGNITIYRTFIIDENKTKIILNITAKNPITNISLYEEIPKCAAKLAKEINLTNATIIEEDPLILWNFKKIEEELIQYTINQNLPESCRKLFKTIIIRELYPKESSFIPIISIIIAVIIGIILLTKIRDKRD